MSIQDRLRPFVLDVLEENMYYHPDPNVILDMVPQAIFLGSDFTSIDLRFDDYSFKVMLVDDDETPLDCLVAQFNIKNLLENLNDDRLMPGIRFVHFPHSWRNDWRRGPMWVGTLLGVEDDEEMQINNIHTTMVRYLIYDLEGIELERDRGAVIPFQAEARLNNYIHLSRMLGIVEGFRMGSMNEITSPRVRMMILRRYLLQFLYTLRDRDNINRQRNGEPPHQRRIDDAASSSADGGEPRILNFDEDAIIPPDNHQEDDQEFMAEANDPQGWRAEGNPLNAPDLPDDGWGPDIIGIEFVPECAICAQHVIPIANGAPVAVTLYQVIACLPQIHIFHTACINQMLDGGDFRCPYDRNQIGTLNVLRITPESTPDDIRRIMTPNQ